MSPKGSFLPDDVAKDPQALTLSREPRLPLTKARAREGLDFGLAKVTPSAGSSSQDASANRIFARADVSYTAPFDSLYWFRSLASFQGEMIPDRASAVPRGKAVLNGAVEASKPGCEIALTLTKYCLPANNTPGGTVTVCSAWLAKQQ